MIQGSNFPTASTPDTESTAEFISSPASFGPSFTTGFPFEDEPRKGKKGKKGKRLARRQQSVHASVRRSARLRRLSTSAATWPPRMTCCVK